MKLSDFDYDLPRELIAQEPAEHRDAARLLSRSAAGETQHLTIASLPDLLKPGDLVVANDTRVRRARLFAHRATGGRVELFLLGHAAEDVTVWRALVNPARKLKVGERLTIEVPRAGTAPQFELEPLERLPHDADPTKPGPTWRLAFRRIGGERASGEALAKGAHAAQDARDLGAMIEALIEDVGHVPLPPYIERHQGQGEEEARHEDRDAERYQTVFAKHPGAVAAPTAGLHLTPELLDRFKARGIDFARVTLHVGLGTFAPVEVEDIAQHKMHTEEYELSEETVRAVEACRARGGRVVAVGTTTVRVLESALVQRGDGERTGVADAATSATLRPGRGATDIFITPGYTFQTVDVLLTNFHLPKSTLLMLVSAFIGKDACFDLYRLAIAEQYRFFSFGDAMLLEKPHGQGGP